MKRSTRSIGRLLRLGIDQNRGHRMSAQVDIAAYRHVADVIDAVVSHRIEGQYQKFTQLQEAIATLPEGDVQHILATYAAWEAYETRRGRQWLLQAAAFRLRAEALLAEILASGENAAIYTDTRRDARAWALLKTLREER